jgi:hypothetical protein
MRNKYYEHKLYPFQDEVLRVVAAINTPFYLTGGTALSRHYLHHRFSDDLDFFTNAHSGFQKEAEKILIKLRESINTQIVVSDTDFLRVRLQKDEVNLKMDFINDVPHHMGGFGTFFGCQIDNPLNILSNKLTALSRDAPKDYCDIVFIAQSYPFHWADILEGAKQKDVWVNELAIFELIHHFDVNTLNNIPWVKEVNLNALKEHVKIIAMDILKCRGNSLAGT